MSEWKMERGRNTNKKKEYGSFEWTTKEELKKRNVEKTQQSRFQEMPIVWANGGGSMSSHAARTADAHFGLCVNVKVPDLYADKSKKKK